MQENVSSIVDSNRTKLTNLCSIKAFIGREFLTWLWFKVESSDELQKVHSTFDKKTYHFDLWIEDYLIFESPSSMTHTQTLRGGTPSQSIEAAAALKTGKFIKQMKIGLSIEGFGEFSATLSDSDLFPRSLKFMRVHEDGNHNADGLADRIVMVEAFLAVFDLIFQDFLRARIKDSWLSLDAKKIRSWINNRYQSQIRV